MKTIKVFLSQKTKHFSSSHGQYGIYIKLTEKKGVKIVKTKRDACKEAAILKRANIVDFVPRFFGVAEVYIKGEKSKRFGILQEHIKGQECSGNQFNDIFPGLKRELRQKSGISYDDNNPKNLLKTKEGKLYLIDFTPQWINKYANLF